MVSFSFEAIGTSWVIDIDDINLKKQKILEQEILRRIEEFDKTYSRFREDSLIFRISKSPGNYVFPKEDKVLFELYKKLYNLSGGLFTPLVGNLLEDAGYDANYSLTPKKLRKVLMWEEVMKYSHPNLNIKKPITLDFGAAGKGYLIDIVGGILEKAGIKSFCIDGGGDILYKNASKKSIKIGLEHPKDINQVIGVVELLNESICGSSTNRRSWGRFHHILNPRTRTPEANILSVWVIAKTALLADGLTTTLFFVDPEKLKKEFNFEYLILYPDFTIKKSANFSAELYYN